MTKSGMNLQDSFLNQVRKENTEIMLMLLDGTRLNGYVRGFDNFTVIMNVRGSQHLIYKHAIAQIVSRRLTHGEGEQPREGGQAAGAPAQEGAAPAEEQPQPQPRPDNHRREGAPRRDRGEQRGDRPERNNDDAQANKSKFNTLDFSSIKIEQEKQA